jgi:hypothetical protein
MSHRNALVASIALTLFVALGIFAARDRLFETGASAGNDVSPAATAPAGTTAIETTDGARRVIEVTLPQPTPVSINREWDDEGEDDEGEDDEETRSSRTSRHDDDEDDEEDEEDEEHDDD